MDSRHLKDNKSKIVVSIILDNKFWNDCFVVVKLISLVVHLLCIVDYDGRPSMVYMYEGMYKVHVSINKIFNYKQKTIKALYIYCKTTLG